MSSIWDDPAVKPSGDFVKFETVGDAVTGTVLDVSFTLSKMANVPQNLCYVPPRATAH